MGCTRSLLAGAKRNASISESRLGVLRTTPVPL